MDGEANFSKEVSDDMMMGVAVAIEGIMPIVAFAVMIGIILLYHMIGVKIGIFPPIFERKKKCE